MRDRGSASGGTARDEARGRFDGSLRGRVRSGSRPCGHEQIGSEHISSAFFRRKRTLPRPCRGPPARGRLARVAQCPLTRSNSGIWGLICSEKRLRPEGVWLARAFSFAAVPCWLIPRFDFRGDFNTSRS